MLRYEEIKKKVVGGSVSENKTIGGVGLGHSSFNFRDDLFNFVSSPSSSHFHRLCESRQLFDAPRQ